MSWRPALPIAAAVAPHNLIRGVSPAADLLIKETQRRNTFLLYAEASAAGALTAEGEAAQGDPQPAGPQRARGGGKAAGSASPQQPPQHPAASVVGYIIFTTTGLNAHISKLAVAAEWRRRGIARALVRAAVAAARTERRVASVSLHVDADNAPALGLYLGEGFVSEALLEVRGPRLCRLPCLPSLLLAAVHLGGVCTCCGACDFWWAAAPACHPA